MKDLIISDIAERPGRAISTIFGVAVGVVLVVVMVGLATGMLESVGQRESNVGAELLFQPPGSFSVGLTTTPLSLPVQYAGALRQVRGVRATTPVGRYLRSGAKGLGFELIEGVAFEPSDDHASYAQVTGIRVKRGRKPVMDDEVVIDRVRAHERNEGIGSTIELLGRKFTVAGIYEPEVGPRVKMRLDAMQRLLGVDRKCSWILIKVDSPDIQETVALRIEGKFPGNQIIFTRDIPRFYDEVFPSLTVFLNLIVGLAVFISGLVTLLAMYASVTERTWEIGILKALGAPKPFIVSVIETEALLLSAIGVAVGQLSAIVIKFGITKFTTLVVEYDFKWLLIAASLALLGGALGAVYPAFRAANQDPVRALAYE